MSSNFICGILEKVNFVELLSFYLDLSLTGYFVLNMKDNIFLEFFPLSFSEVSLLQRREKFLFFFCLKF